MAGAGLCAAAVLAGAGCRRSARDIDLTYYNPEHALTVRHPASWTHQLATQPDGSTYRYFAAPGKGRDRKPAATVTLIAGALESTLDAYAQNYLASGTVESVRDVARPSASGKAWRLASADGTTRHTLLLLQEGQRVYGLFGQGEAGPFAAQKAAIEEMENSFTLERYAHYVDERNEPYRFALKVPPSWKLGRNFSGGGTFSKQYTSPPIGAEKGQTVHASLTVTAEPLPAGATLEGYYKANVDKLGEAYKVRSHTRWKDGWADAVGSETQMAMYQSRRYYRISGERGYALTCEARDDIYHRVYRWCDMIANTFKVGAELDAP